VLIFFGKNRYPTVMNQLPSQPPTRSEQPVTDTSVTFISESLADAGTPLTPLVSVPKNNSSRLTWVGILFFALVMMVAFAAWAYWEYQRYANLQATLLESGQQTDSVIPSPASTASTPPLASVAPSPSPLPSTDETAVPSEWIKTSYTANGQNIWQVTHPPVTTTNQAGLSEGNLSLRSTWNETQFRAEFSYPKFESGLPQTFDQWVTDFVTAETALTGDVLVEKQVKDGVLLRIVSNGLYHSPTQGSTALPATLIFIWSHSDEQGDERNPALIIVTQTSSGERQVEAFAKLLVAGLSF
jgi:hypothetical protein